MKYAWLVCVALVCFHAFGADLSAPAILPSPYRVEPAEGRFEFVPATRVLHPPDDPDTAPVAEQLAVALRSATGQAVPVRGATEPEDGGIFLSRTKAPEDGGREGYELVVAPGRVVIRAQKGAGLYYAVQTLLQLLPQGPPGAAAPADALAIPSLKIEDRPKYGWRSFMLDSGRQFQSVESIKHILDWMAMLKLNVFHWHLTEDQGWRIEILKYPRLTDVGSRVADGPEQEGYYTQSQIRDVVRYAGARHIMVVPEIDVPGHSAAALTAYPELACRRKSPESGAVSPPHVLCGGREHTYRFLAHVLDEVCTLFPSPYIHIGGDEVPMKSWNQCPDCTQRIRGGVASGPIGISPKTCSTPGSSRASMPWPNRCGTLGSACLSTLSIGGFAHSIHGWKAWASPSGPPFRAPRNHSAGPAPSCVFSCSFPCSPLISEVRQRLQALS